MGTYAKILTEAHEKGEPIGPNHHKFDQQLKEWLVKNPETARKVEAQVKEQAERKHSEAGDKQQTLDNLVALRAKIVNAGKKVQAELSLHDKYRAEQQAKIAAGYKTNDPTDAIPSRGNGL